MHPRGEGSQSLATYTSHAAACFHSEAEYQQQAASIDSAMLPKHALVGPGSGLVVLGLLHVQVSVIASEHVVRPGIVRQGPVVRWPPHQPVVVEV